MARLPGRSKSRTGLIADTVQITVGRVSNAKATWATTYYPIALREQVVKRQSAHVDLVSRATASARAFADGARIVLDLARKFEVIRVTDPLSPIS